MFNHTHYVPILRWKRGERIALENLRAQHRRKITPLLEVVPKDFAPNREGIPRAPNRVLAQKADEVRTCWGRGPFFLDLQLLQSPLAGAKQAHPLVVFGEEARARQLRLVPVTGLTRSPSYQSAVASLVKTDNQGACIRVTPKDIQCATFPRDLQRLLSDLRIEPTQVDLLVDYGLIDDSSPPIESLCARVPKLSLSRTFTVVSGAFPKDLTGFKVGQHLLSRLDWLAWRDHMLASTKLTRRPSYGDYTTQHPSFSEPPAQANFSASIRYTTDEDWVIMRGEGVFTDDGPGFAQWPANAQLLCGRHEFCGPAFSYGDEYIKGMSLQTRKPGSAETWLRAGVNHHLTFVVRQIASFFGVSIVGAP